MHRYVSGGGNPLSCEGLPKSQGKNLQVQAKRGVIYIPDVQFEPILPRQFVPAMNLGQTRDAWADFVPSGLLRRVAFQVLDEQRPWSNETHIAAHDVPEFRQLIQAGTAQEPSEACQAQRVWQKNFIAVPEVGHRPELDNCERAAAKAWALLPEQDRGPMQEPDEHTNSRKYWDEKQERGRGGCEVEGSLEPATIQSVHSDASMLPGWPRRTHFQTG